jgi:beta-lactamase regulating signal transducer with metallopeptidase domain
VMALDFRTLSEVVAGRALNTIVEGMALAGLSWLVLRFNGGRSAVTRFAVWFFTLLAVVSLPLFMRANGSGVRKPELEISGPWAMNLLVVWAVIAGVLLLRLAASLRHMRRLRRQCREVELSAYPELADVVCQHSRHRRVRLLVSDEIRVPTALGFFRPAVVLPAWALCELSGEELRVVLLHELAHLRRWDDWTNLAQKVLKAIFFFHPAVWWIESRLAFEREVACDDLVVEQTANPQRYAASLVSLAEKALAGKTRVRRALALAQSALGHMRQTSLRLAKILDPGRTGAKHGWRPALAAIAAVTAVVFVATPYAPEVIAFKAQPEAWVGASLSTASAMTGSAIPIKAVRASLVSGRTADSQGLLRVRHATGNAKAPVMIPARSNVRRSNQPLLLAKAEARSKPDQVLVMIKSAAIDADGSTRWMLCVWRLRSGTGQVSGVEEIVMNSI